MKNITKCFFAIVALVAGSFQGGQAMPMHSGTERERARDLRDLQDAMIRQALLGAIKYGDPKAVDFLINKIGVDIETQDDWGRTALMYAIQDGNADIVLDLVVAGADIKVVDKRDLSARDFVGSTKREALLAALEGKLHPTLIKDMIIKKNALSANAECLS
jgi:ankyrin repeat protein